MRWGAFRLQLSAFSLQLVSAESGKRKAGGDRQFRSTQVNCGIELTSRNHVLLQGQGWLRPVEAMVLTESYPAAPDDGRLSE